LETWIAGRTVSRMHWSAEIRDVQTAVVRGGKASSRTGPANSAQKLARPGFGPPAEPAREVKISRRHAARIRAPHMQRARAALASARGPWPCSLASDPLAGHRSCQSFLPPTRLRQQREYLLMHEKPRINTCG